jgi:hypothetical protein
MTLIKENVISWLLVGIIPSFMGLGWKYSIFASTLPPISGYCFFECNNKKRGIFINNS